MEDDRMIEDDGCITVYPIVGGNQAPAEPIWHIEPGEVWVHPMREGPPVLGWLPNKAS
jgi:hypothetical protein